MSHAEFYHTNRFAIVCLFPGRLCSGLLDWEKAVESGKGKHGHAKACKTVSVRSNNQPDHRRARHG